MTRPVSTYENEKVKGLALCFQPIFDDKIAEITALRERHAKYEAELPTDPIEAIGAAQVVLAHGTSSYPNGFEEALHMAHALRPMLEKLRDDDQGGPDWDAMLWIADHIMFGLEDAQSSLDRAMDVLRKAKLHDVRSRD